MTKFLLGAALFATFTVNASTTFNPPQDRPRPQNVPEAGLC